MVEPEQDKTVAERLVNLANATGNAVLVLNADIDADSFVQVASALDSIGDQEALSLILNSRGGYIEFAFHIAKAIRASCKELEVLVPARAKSAATLIALSANRISLGQFGELGPLDPQVPDLTGSADRRSPLEIVKGLEYLRTYYIETFELMVLFLLEQAGMDVAHTMEYATGALSPVAGALYNSVNYRELGEAVRYLTVSQQYARETIRRWSPLEQDSSAVDDVVEKLVWEYPDHGHIIDVEEAQRIGLKNVDHLPTRLESLCLEVINRGILIKAVLPTTDADVEREDDSLLATEDENETEHGTYCQ